MTNDRYQLLMKSDTEELSEAELREGWHFCPDWDGLLIGPNCGELRGCCCEYPNKPAPPPEEPLDPKDSAWDL